MTRKQAEQLVGSLALRKGEINFDQTAEEKEECRIIESLINNTIKQLDK